MKWRCFDELDIIHIFKSFDIFSSLSLVISNYYYLSSKWYVTRIFLSIYTPEKVQINGYEVSKHCLPNSELWRSNRKMKNSKNKTTSKRLSTKIEQIVMSENVFFLLSAFSMTIGAGKWQKKILCRFTRNQHKYLGVYCLVLMMLTRALMSFVHHETAS